MKDKYDIQQDYNIISIIPTSKQNRSRVLNLLKEVGYDQKDFHIQSTSFPFNVFENVSPVKHKLWQFMNNCHNAENVKKDINPTFVHKNNSAKLMKISYLDETYTGEIPTDLLVGTNTNTDLSVRFKREYRNAFPDLKNVFYLLRVVQDAKFCM